MARTIDQLRAAGIPRADGAQMDGRGEPKFNQLRNDCRHGEILARMKLPFKPDVRPIKSQAELH